MGNTFGATALSSYGGFWFSFAIILTPGGFQIESILEEESAGAFADSFGLFLMVSTHSRCKVSLADHQKHFAFHWTNQRPSDRLYNMNILTNIRRAGSYSHFYS